MSPIISGGGSGGSSPQTRGYYVGNQVAINHGARELLTWSTKLSGDALLDISVPSAPTIVTAGVYAFTVQIVPGNLSVGGVYGVSFELDRNGDDPSVFASSPPANAIQAAPSLVVPLTYYVPAGGLIYLAVTNNDPAADVNFVLANALIQRLS